jgi:hypothetical protein
VPDRDASLHILQHALGLDDFGRGKAYRNHFATGPECDNWGLCMAHVEAGRMKKHEPRAIFGGGEHCCFVVTDAGKAFVREHSPRPSKRQRSRDRYLEWLRISDVCPDLTFGEWLKQSRKVGAHA